MLLRPLFLFFRIHSVKNAVHTPTVAAPKNIGKLDRLPVTKNAIAKPGSTACVIASPNMLMRRSTRKFPTIEQETADNSGRDNPPVKHPIPRERLH